MNSELEITISSPALAVGGMLPFFEKAVDINSEAVRKIRFIVRIFFFNA
jgi:hypothetical protein